MTDPELIKLIEEYTALTLSDGDPAEIELYDNLGIYGDDADELLNEYARRFGVSITGFDFASHFPCEGYEVPPGSLLPWIKTRGFTPLTIGDLQRGIERKYLGLDPATVESNGTQPTGAFGLFIGGAMIVVGLLVCFAFPKIQGNILPGPVLWSLGGLTLAVIGTPVITLAVSIFVWRVFRGMWPGKKGCGWLALIPTALLAPVIGFAVFVLTNMLWQWHPEIDFDHERWLRKTERRHWMTRNIIESEMLVGKTRDEAEQLLSYDYFFPYEYVFADGIRRTDTTRMVWYIGSHRPALSLMARMPYNSLVASMEEGVIVEVSEEHYTIPDGPIVRMSGFVVDPSLDSVVFSSRDSVKVWRRTTGGLARVERYFEKDGMRSYVIWPGPRPRGISDRKWVERVASMPRDTLHRMDHMHYNMTLGYVLKKYTYDFDTFCDFHNYYEHLYFGYRDGGAIFEVRLIVDALPPMMLRDRHSTTVIEAEVWMHPDTDNGPKEHAPDSVYLAFNRVPVGGERLTGRIHVLKRGYEDISDMHFEGTFELTLPERYIHPEVVPQ